MTAASELKSAAVVQKVVQKVVRKDRAIDESRKRKTPSQKVVEAVKKEAKAEEVKAVAVSKEVTDKRNEACRTVSTKPGNQASRTNEEVKQVSAANGSTTAGATQTVAAAYETSGSSAATASKAASMQATRLPVSVFFKNSRIFPTIQQNRVSLRHPVPGHSARAGRAA